MRGFSIKVFWMARKLTKNAVDDLEARKRACDEVLIDLVERNGREVDVI